jgi:hypothetical protein
MKYSKYFGTKQRGFIKIKSVLAPKGAIHLLNENINYVLYHFVSFMKFFLSMSDITVTQLIH